MARLTKSVKYLYSYLVQLIVILKVIFVVLRKRNIMNQIQGSLRRSDWWGGGWGWEWWGWGQENQSNGCEDRQKLVKTGKWSLKLHGIYGWRELLQLQVSFCRDNSFVVTNTGLLQQNTPFVMTKVCLPQQNLCHDKSMSWQNIFGATNMTSILWSQEMFCCNKHVCHDESNLIMTKLLLQQHYVCHDKYLVRQKFWQATICHDKHTFVRTKDMFVRTKMTLVAAPTNDSHQAC